MIAVLSVLAGCAGSIGRPANDPRLSAAVREYYNLNAAERDEGCTAPIMALLEALQVHNSFYVGNTLRLYSRYRYEQREPATGALVCSGVGERYFMATRTTAGPQIVGMSGPSRSGTP
jgi:hypothetical protein